MVALVRHRAKVDREKGISILYMSKPKAFELNRQCPASSWRTHILLGGLTELAHSSARLTSFTGGNEAKMSCDDIPQDAPMTVQERRLLKALANCHFPQGSLHSAFCREILKAVASAGRYRLTGDQRATLWRLGHHYRLRLPEDVQGILENRKAPREGSKHDSTFPLKSRRRTR
jgi:hypothetical protein